MSTRSSSNLIPPLSDPESVIQNQRRNLRDPSLLLDFEEINMSNNLNINPGPPPAGPPPQNHNGPPGPSLHMPAPDLRTMEDWGTFMKRRPAKCYDLIENMTSHHNDWDTSAHRGKSSSSITSSSFEIATLTQEMAKMRKDMLHMYRSKQQVISVTPSCDTYGGPHSYYECQAASGYTQVIYATTRTYNSGGNTYQHQGNRNLFSYHSNNFLGPPGFNPPNNQNQGGGTRTEDDNGPETRKGGISRDLEEEDDWTTRGGTHMVLSGSTWSVIVFGSCSTSLEEEERGESGTEGQAKTLALRVTSSAIPAG
nr:hypothetical protein [Tanacetum cinerariifolium]